MKSKASREYKFRDREHGAVAHMLRSGEKCICFRCRGVEESARLEKAIVKNAYACGYRHSIMAVRRKHMLYIINAGAVDPIDEEEVILEQKGEKS